jgi:hypothetical protein
MYMSLDGLLDVLNSSEMKQTEFKIYLCDKFKSFMYDYSISFVDDNIKPFSSKYAIHAQICYSFNDELFGCDYVEEILNEMVELSDVAHTLRFYKMKEVSTVTYEKG